MKFGFVDEHRHIWPVRVMCPVLGLSVSGYYAWRSRVESPRAAANRVLLEDIRRIHGESSGTANPSQQRPLCSFSASPTAILREQTDRRRRFDPTSPT